MLSVSGSYARNDHHAAMLAILGVSALITLLAYYYHEEILQFVKRHRASRGEE